MSRMGISMCVCVCEGCVNIRNYHIQSNVVKSKTTYSEHYLCLWLLRATTHIHVTERSGNFVVEDCLALNCNLSSLFVFPNKFFDTLMVKFKVVLCLLAYTLPLINQPNGLD